jgi:hypothetical protein
MTIKDQNVSDVCIAVMVFKSIIAKNVEACLYAHTCREGVFAENVVVQVYASTTR